MALTSQTDGGVLEPSEQISAGWDRLRATLLLANGATSVAGILSLLWMRSHHIGIWGLGGFFIWAAAWALPEVMLFAIAGAVTMRRKDRGERSLGLLWDWAVALGAGWALMFLLAIAGKS